MSAADLIGGAENLGDSGEVGWEELVSEAPPTTLSLGDSKSKKIIKLSCNNQLHKYHKAANTVHINFSKTSTSKNGFDKHQV